MSNPSRKARLASLALRLFEARDATQSLRTENQQAESTDELTEARLALVEANLDADARRITQELDREIRPQERTQ